MERDRALGAIVPTYRFASKSIFSMVLIRCFRRRSCRSTPICLLHASYSRGGSAARGHPSKAKRTNNCIGLPDDCTHCLSPAFP